MKVLMLSTDENIFQEGSEVRQRMIEYGSLFEELHIIVKNQKSKIKNQKFGNVFVYPTNTNFKLFYFWNAYKIGKQIIRNWKLEIRNCVLSTQDPFETGLVGYFLKKKFGLPLQIQIHTDFLSPYFWQESLKNKIRVLLAKWLVRKADCLRVVSQRIKDSILRSSQDLGSCDDPNIHVLPIFVDVEAIKNAPIKTDLHQKYPGYDFIILMASRLTREKNIGMAIQALTDAKNANETRMMRTLLLIVGDGPELEELKAKSEKLKIDANVKFESWTNDLISYYKTADLFLNTSNYEGYGRTIIEALAAGCPVISTNVGIAPEFIKASQSGIVIAPKDARGLSDALMEIMSNKGKYKGTIEQPVIKDKNEYLKLYKEGLCTITGNSLKKN